MTQRFVGRPLLAFAAALCLALLPGCERSGGDAKVLLLGEGRAKAG